VPRRITDDDRLVLGHGRNCPVIDSVSPGAYHASAAGICRFETSAVGGDFTAKQSRTNVIKINKLYKI